MSLFSLMDCNNFFVSCERVFNPALENRPVVVLSNNDGCIIARSNEAKALNIPMGAPLHEYKTLIQRHKVVTLSSNFELYGDMSRRVMRLLREYCEEVEIYSIDEAFIKFPDMSIEAAESWSQKLRQLIRQGTGIPVSKASLLLRP